MRYFHLFTDGSVNTQTKTGFGASLLLPDLDISMKEAKRLVNIRRFDNTSSTRMEIQTLISALTDIMDLNLVGHNKLMIYTDSQNIIGLPERRVKLEKNNFLSSKNIELNNKQLYQSFYRLIDRLDVELNKVKGHKPSGMKTNIDTLFGIVDQSSRHALRNHK